MKLAILVVSANIIEVWKIGGATVVTVNVFVYMGLKGQFRRTGSIAVILLLQDKRVMCLL